MMRIFIIQVHDPVIHLEVDEVLFCVCREKGQRDVKACYRYEYWANINTVCVCVFFPFILGIKFVGRTSRGHTGGRSHRISFFSACLNFSREKASAIIPFPRRP